MARKGKKICNNCMRLIDSISLELKSLELVEDSLSKLTDQAIRSKSKFTTVDDIYLEVVSTALYNSINDIKKILA
jgi:hypothetical protein